MSLEQYVAAKLAAQRGNEDAAALWKRLWAAYEKGGEDGARELLGELLDDPEAKDDRPEDA
jgi:hypothetical protein